MILHSFKESFKKARKLKNLTQESFCTTYKKETGTSIDIKTVRNWEQGRSTPVSYTHLTLPTICSV